MTHAKNQTNIRRMFRRCLTSIEAKDRTKTDTLSPVAKENSTNILLLFEMTKYMIILGTRIMIFLELKSLDSFM